MELKEMTSEDYANAIAKDQEEANSKDGKDLAKRLNQNKQDQKARDDNALADSMKTPPKPVTKVETKAEKDNKNIENARTDQELVDAMNGNTPGNETGAPANLDKTKSNDEISTVLGDDKQALTEVKTIKENISNPNNVPPQVPETKVKEIYDRAKAEPSAMLTATRWLTAISCVLAVTLGVPPINFKSIFGTDQEETYLQSLNDDIRRYNSIVKLANEEGISFEEAANKIAMAKAQDKDQAGYKSDKTTENQIKLYREQVEGNKQLKELENKLSIDLAEHMADINAMQPAKAAKYIWNYAKGLSQADRDAYAKFVKASAGTTYWDQAMKYAKDGTDFVGNAASTITKFKN